MSHPTLQLTPVLGSTYDICIYRRRYNNYANYSIGWAAGGVKIFVGRAIVDQCELHTYASLAGFTYCCCGWAERTCAYPDGPLVINNNTVRHNYGPGLWSDGGGTNIHYTNNIITDK